MHGFGQMHTISSKEGRADGMSPDPSQLFPLKFKCGQNYKLSKLDATTIYPQVQYLQFENL